VDVVKEIPLILSDALLKELVLVDGLTPHLVLPAMCPVIIQGYHE
jgi:hypothetical protein